MRCRVCGDPLRVVETREEAYGLIVRRVRLCPRGHRYSTYEVDDSLQKTIIKFAERRDRIEHMMDRIERYRRNERIVRRAASGEKHELIAVNESIAPNTVSHVVRNHK